MKVVAFNGSARKDGNTTILIKAVFRELKKKGLRQNLFSWQVRRFQAVLPAGNVLRRKTSGVR
jgi:NAD(P)H-dependent FMN reductase